MSRDIDEDGFDAAYIAVHGPSSTPIVEARARAKREKAMRSPYGSKHHPKHKGDRVQFNRKMARGLRDRVAAVCKRVGINETDALEQAFQLWLTHMAKGSRADG
jgi:hypothetical protein